MWAAVLEHLYSGKYREIKKVTDLLYLSELSSFSWLRDAALINRNARKVLGERLDPRNLCRHPTGYRPGREETVIFIESLIKDVLSGTWLLWR